MVAITTKLTSPLLGTMIRNPTATRMCVRQGDRLIADLEVTPPSLGLDPALLREDWTANPWFLQPLPEPMENLLTSSGFGRHGREIAAAALKRLYPHDVCLEMASDEQRLAIVYGLFEPFVMSLLPLLPLGIDLATCQPWEHGRLLTDLRSARAFWGAEREVWAWARLLRGHLSIVVEPDGRGSTKPDFAVTAANECCYVEVKTNPIPDAERILAELRARVSPDAEALGHPDRFVHVRGSESLGDAFFAKEPWVAVLQCVPELRQELEKVATELKAGRHAVGRYRCGRLAEIEVSDRQDFRGQTAIDLWAGLPIQKLVARVIRKVREANSQTPRNRHAIAVVDVGGLRDLARLQDAVRFEAAARPDQFECVVAVIAIASSPDPTRLRKEVTVCMPVREPALSNLEWQVAEALLGRSPNESPLVSRMDAASDEMPFGPGVSLLRPFTAVAGQRPEADV